MTLAAGAMLVACQVTSASEPREPRRPRGGQGGGYSLEQAVSDRAQLNTIAFDGMAFLSGDAPSCTFLPPGKVCDYFGFQYMRDIQPEGGGHNTSFLTVIADNTLAILTDQQKALLVELGGRQAPRFRDFAVSRYPLIWAFYRQLTGDVPAGTSLDKAAVVAYSADLWELDGQLAYERAAMFGELVRSLDERQKAALAALPYGDWRAWPRVGEGLHRRGLRHDIHVAAMTYASEFFSWYAGSLEGDVYFCPERHATYFGSFYVKDMPVMRRQNASISTSRTSDGGEQFLRLLNPDQRAQVTGLVDSQRPLLSEMVTVRRAISGELRKFAAGDTGDQATVLERSRRYGELDGEMSYLYAMAFSAVGRTLTAEQKQAVDAIRQLPVDPRGTVFVYSEPVALRQAPESDFLFGAAR